MGGGGHGYLSPGAGEVVLKAARDQRVHHLQGWVCRIRVRGWRG